MPIFSRGFFLPRIYRRIMHKYYANDLWIDLRIAAKKDTVEYIMQNMMAARVVNDRPALFNFSVPAAPKEGLVLEFGVMKGASSKMIAAKCGNRTVHGFDSFEGLPSDWCGTMSVKGTFSVKGRLPKVPDNVKLHVGWFDKTLPAFLATTQEPAAFIHIDCDIYESTKCVFSLLADRIQPGTVIQFDEYYNYPGWRQHEYKAFKEFIAAHNRAYEYIGYSAEQGHVAVRITK